MLYSRQSMDRGIRIMGGCVVIGLALVSGEAINFAAKVVTLTIGAYALVTGLINFCPLAHFILKEKQISRRKQSVEKDLAAADVGNLYFFEGMATREIDKVLEQCNLKSCPPDQEVIQEGKHKKVLYIIYSGQFKIVKRIAGDETKIIGTISDGDTFGELSFFDQDPPGVSVVSMQDSKVLEIDEFGFAELIGKDPYLGIKVLSRLMRITSARVRTMNEQIASLGSWLVQKRKAHA